MTASRLLRRERLSYLKAWASEGRRCRTAPGQASDAALERALALLNHSQALARVGGWEVDLEANSLYWTDEIFRIYELDKNAYTPTVESSIQFYAPEWQPVITQAVRRAIDLGENFDLDLELITARGRRLWVHASSQVIVRGGKVIKVLGAFRDISEERRAAELLVQEHSVLTGVIESAQSPIFSVDRSFCYTSFNQAHAAVMKTLYGRDIMLGTSLLDVQTVVGDRAVAEANLHRALRGEAFTVEAMSGDEGLSRAHFEVTHQPIHGPDGSVTGVALFVRDITERKRCEEAAQTALAQAERFRKAMDHLSTYLYMKDRQRRYVYANQPTLELFGCSAEELVGSGDDRFFPPETVARLHEVDSRVLERGESTAEEIVSIAPDGTRRVYWELKTPLYENGSKDQIWGLCGISTDITERKQAEAARYESERVLRSILDNMQDVYFRADMNGHFLYISPSGPTVYGYDSVEEMMGIPATDLYLRIEQRERLIDQIRMSGAAQDFVGEGRRKDGSGFWVSMNARFVRDAEGVPIGIEGVVRDIDARKRAEDALAASEERYRRLFEMNRTTMLILDPEDGGIVDANPAACAYYGWSRDEIRRMRITDLNTGSAEEIQPGIDEACGGKLDHFHFIHRLADGSLRNVEVSSSPVPDQGRILLYSIITDITERVIAEAALWESEQRYRLISENTEDVIWVMDIVRGRFSYVSPSVARLRGYSPEEIMALPVADALTPESHARVLANMVDRIPRYEAGDETARVTHMQVDQPCKDGSIVPTEVVTTLLKDDQGRISQILGITRDIRQRLEAERELIEGEHRLRTVFETSADGLVLLDRDTLDILDANPAFCAMYGYTLEELTRLKATDISAEPAATESSTRAGDYRVGLRLHRRKDGSIFPVELVANAFEEKGRHLFVVSARDITLRLQEEDALRNRVLQLQIMLDLAALPDSKSGKDLLKEGLELAARMTRSQVGFLHLLLEDEETLELTAWTGHTLQHCTAAFDTHYPLSKAGVWADAVRQKVTVVHNNYQTVQNQRGFPEGHFPLTRELVVPVVEGGKVRLILGVGNKGVDYDDFDIGQLEVVAQDLWKSFARQQVTDALRASEISLKAAFEQAMVGMAQFGPDGALIKANDRFRQILGLSASDLTALDLESLTHPEDRLPTSASALEILTGLGGNLSMEKRFIRPDGRFVWTQVYETLVNPGTGKAPYLLRILEDISDRKQLEAELQDLNRDLERRVAQRTQQLEAVNQELEAFSYSVSHDLRAPLRAIAGFSEALTRDRDSTLSPEGEAHLRRIQGGTARMSQLIEDLLQLSRVGRDDFASLPMDLGAMADHILARFRENEPAREVRWEMDGPVPVQGDPRLLRILLENLLGNAWKFTSKTGSAVIKLGCTAQDRQVEVSISDNGAGFPSKQAGKLFTPFQRLHRLEDFPGTGIGLAIAKRIIRRHGGQIWAEGEVGKGASVHFTLPAVEEGR